ncbi:disease resistance protein-like protein MsR1, putative [Medicago truncatula]|uniref:Disease resistance protein-like protein MsR1, putative n=1 Tax=Medicago truncatula TaxID=3880 RepID=G7L1Z5_MEDTR|nr:disease resistance protein-like protein MsR1, putative [Medicago truncatula]
MGGPHLRGDPPNSFSDLSIFNNHSIVLHDLLRELGIYQTSQEPIQQRKSLLIDVIKNKCNRWLRV